MLALLTTSARAASTKPASPPLILGINQSRSVVPSRGTAYLGVTARDPQGSALTFTWTATTGALDAPVHGVDISEVTWTAPDCIIPGTSPVKVTVTNAHGLSAEVDFSFHVGPTLYENQQAPFATGQFERPLNMVLTSNGALQYPNPYPEPFALSAENIVFPTEHDVSLTFLSQTSVASHSMGWLYYDDVVARGYVDTKGTPDSSDDTLVDTNGNGITDFHEDLYNLAPFNGSQARPYVGKARRCLQTFYSGGFNYGVPDLALNASCSTAFSRLTLDDARPGRTSERIPVDVVGALLSSNVPNGAFSDGGLFPRIPNLLEPAAPENGNKGLGNLPFLLTDDDSNFTTFKRLAPVNDSDDWSEGIPDYDVSAYTPSGLRRATNPDPGITSFDRTVKLGLVQGGRELVFFLIAYYDPTHLPNDDGTVYPCLKKAVDGRCTLHLRSPTSVFFSKSRWNLDQDSVGTTPVAEHNMGCIADERCTPQDPNNYSCALGGSSQRLCGWLDDSAYYRLRTPGYGNIVLPKERSGVLAASHGSMPHLEIGTATTLPGTWLLGFEDLNGGGDRNFNNVTFLLKASSTTGLVRSHVLSDNALGHCAISRVRIEKADGNLQSCQTAPTGTEFSYAIATDCKVCTGVFCQRNPSPSWMPVPFAEGQSSTILDLSPSSGDQLCWKATVRSLDPTCRPELFHMNIGYELNFVP
ncbi:DUF4114 domain-containing protein [Myxococcus sp. AM011]|uniref:DUF4114 domain-containing protein n=1 Tax=Myxococcus sp. AM011 TaxID=2745200 RepID=UPI00159628E1|nr:DUF4114 domain-containing protein [Myxococcus sp. AM011]NVJ27883.1 DUF4114 domain-containing protein [Myxococcus sp. AM011]